MYKSLALRKIFIGIEIPYMIEKNHEYVLQYMREEEFSEKCHFQT